MEDQLLCAKGAGASRLTNPHAYELRKAFGRSYSQYKPTWCVAVLWELVV
jgi:hypothetical protein